MDAFDAIDPRRDLAAKVGRYQPLMELASGGMATVYLARHLASGGFERLVVLKRVHRHMLKDQRFLDMLRDEARVASAIRHPNVVAVNDVVESDAELILVMDYVEGVSLAALQRAVEARGERLPPAVVGRIVCDVLSGLHAAHEATDARGRPLDLVHRDVSPQNVLVGSDGVSRLIDFGVAKAATRISETTTGIIKGKLRYMSPEQIQQKSIDRRVDLFASGIVLFEALTGTRLFDGQGEGEVLLGVLIQEIRNPSSFVMGLPRAVDSVVEKALARDREQRYGTAAEFLRDLEAALPAGSHSETAECVQDLVGVVLDERRRTLRTKLSVELPDMPGSAEPTTATVVAMPTPARRPWTRVALLVAAIFAGVAVVALVVAGNGARQRAITAQAPPSATPSEATSVIGSAVNSAPIPPNPPATPDPSAQPNMPTHGAHSGRRSAPVVPRPKPPGLRPNPYATAN